MKNPPRQLKLIVIHYGQCLITRCKKKLSWIVLLLFFCLMYEAKAQHSELVGKLDTLTNFSKKHGGFYYRDKNILAYASRFNLTRKCELIGVNVTLSGDTGTCQLRVFGYEGGINAPVIEEDVCEPMFIHKVKNGLETIYIEYKKSVRLESKQFYICVDQISSRVHVITDTVTKQQWCSSRDGEMFYYQMLKTGDNHKSQWLYSKYAFMIEPVIRYEQVQEKMFSLDTNAIVFDSTITTGTMAQVPNNHSISCADVNNDGFIDILNDGRLFVNRNGFKLEEVTQRYGLRGQPKANIFIDINNDGFTDILFIGNQDSTFQNSRLFVNQSGNGFKVTDIELPRISTPNSFSIADINQDGFLDVVIGQQSKKDGKEYWPLLVLLNTKNGQFSDETSVYIPKDILLIECTSLTLRDIDNDGYSDLYLNATNMSGKSLKYILLNKGNKFTQLEIPSINHQNNFSVNEKSNMGVCWYDIDNDGVLDLLSSERIRYSMYKREKQNPSIVYQRTGLQDIVLNPLPISPFIYNDKISSTAWEDLNNDGMPDCLLSTNCECRTTDVYLQNTPLNFVESSREAGLGGLSDLRDVVWLDYNNDGKVDLFCIEGDKLSMYKNNNTNGNNYVNINLKSETGSSCIGKIVKVYSGGNVYTKDIISGRGLLIQDSPVLHFGLGNSSKVDSVIVRDHSYNQKYAELPSNENHLLSFNTLRKDGKPYNIDLQAVPNPSSNILHISYTLPIIANDLDLSVYSLNGTRVKKISYSNRVNSGNYTIDWDGTDESGSKVGSGVYLIKLRMENIERSIYITRID